MESLFLIIFQIR